MSSENKETKEEFKTCLLMVEQLHQQITQIRMNKCNKTIIAEMSRDIEVLEYEPRCRDLRTGHFGKIYAINWGSDTQYILSAAQDGKIIVWTAYSAAKHLLISLKSSWVMTAKFSPLYSCIASGGLDSTISIHSISIGTCFYPFLYPYNIPYNIEYKIVA